MLEKFSTTKGAVVVVEAASMMRTFEFEGSTLVFRRCGGGDYYVTETEVARALKISVSAVGKIFKGSSDEFQPGWSSSELSSEEGRKRRWQRCYSPKGVLLVAMHATRSPVGAAFRVFAVEVLDKLRTGEAGLITPEQLTAIVAAAVSKAIAENDAKWEARLAAVEARFDRVLESNTNMARLAARALAHRRYQKAREVALKNELKIGQRRFSFGGDGTN